MQSRSQSPTSSATVAAADLLNADGNLGRSLLTPQAMSSLIAVLDDFKEMGIKGVTFEVAFPMLLPSFTDSSAYLTFYEHVADAIRQRQMQFDIELNPSFPGFTELPADYSGLTIANYASEQAAEAQIIIDDLRPTYLTIFDEADTFSAHLGLPLDTPDSVAGVVQQELQSLDRRQTMIGAGTGDWESPAIDAALASRTSIDYLSMHVYPIDPQSLQNLDDDVNAATVAHKPVVMDEAWLYKQGAPGIGSPSQYEQSQVLDYFSFSEPIDEQFLTAIMAYARNHGFLYVSPFWTSQFFAYLNWTPQLAAESPSSIRAQEIAAWPVAARQSQFTSTGITYRSLTHSG